MKEARGTSFATNCVDFIYSSFFFIYMYMYILLQVRRSDTGVNYKLGVGGRKKGTQPQRGHRCTFYYVKLSTEYAIRRDREMKRKKCMSFITISTNKRGTHRRLVVDILS